MVIKPDTYLLTAALNRVIPPVGDLPGAGGMELAEEVIKRSAADFRFQDALTRVLGALPSRNDFLALDDDGQDDALNSNWSRSKEEELNLNRGFIFKIFQ